MRFILFFSKQNNFQITTNHWEVAMILPTMKQIQYLTLPFVNHHLPKYHHYFQKNHLCLCFLFDVAFMCDVQIMFFRLILFFLRLLFVYCHLFFYLDFLCIYQNSPFSVIFLMLVNVIHLDLMALYHLRRKQLNIC